MRIAAKAIHSDIKSISRHEKIQLEKGIDTPYKGRYIITIKRSLTTANSEAVSKVSIHALPKDKLCVFRPDNTLAYEFDSVEEGARFLTPQRCSHLSDSEIREKKNIRHIRRVEALTLTEKGKFYLYQNPNHSTCLSLVLWGVNLPSGVTNKLISKQERDMVRIPSYQYGVIIGLLLSDAWLQLQTKQRSINSHLGFKQALDKSKYVWFVFTILCHYCSSYPFLVTGVRSGVRYFGRPPPFFTRALPCFTELHSLFYVDSIKVIPQNIYELLTPVAHCHWIMGDGVARPYGLQLCTDSNSLLDVVRLMNVLIIRYGLNCTLHTKRENQYRIYISSKSIPRLKEIVGNYMHESMSYKLGNGV
jgi:hypothetical protein